MQKSVSSILEAVNKLKPAGWQHWNMCLMHKFLFQSHVEGNLLLLSDLDVDILFHTLLYFFLGLIMLFFYVYLPLFWTKVVFISYLGSESLSCNKSGHEWSFVPFSLKQLYLWVAQALSQLNHSFFSIGIYATMWHWHELVRTCQFSATKTTCTAFPSRDGRSTAESLLQAQDVLGLTWATHKSGFSY